MLRSEGWFFTDVSGLPIGPIFKGEDVQACPLTMGPVRTPETSVRNQPTLCNIPEYDRITILQSNWFISPRTLRLPSYSPDAKLADL